MIPKGDALEKQQAAVGEQQAVCWEAGCRRRPRAAVAAVAAVVARVAALAAGVPIVAVSPQPRSPTNLMVEAARRRIIADFAAVVVVVVAAAVDASVVAAAIVSAVLAVA